MPGDRDRSTGKTAMSTSTIVTFILTLVRHGQTTMNAHNILHGHYEYRLNELGKAEAVKLGQYLRSKKNSATSCNASATSTPNRIYSSPLSRATDTASLIAAHCDYSGPAIAVEPLLIARAYGELTGKSRDHLLALAQAQGLNSMQVAPAGGGENGEQVSTRIAAFMKDILLPEVVRMSKEKAKEKAKETQEAKETKDGEQPDLPLQVMVVTHGGVCRRFIIYLESQGEYGTFHVPLEVKLPNSGVSQFEVTLEWKEEDGVDADDHQEPVAKIIDVKCLSFYQTDHLAKKAAN